MALQLSPEKVALDNAVHLSYFVKRKKGKPSRVAFARLLDISHAGLCMEVSPVDSDLFMESGGTLFILKKNIEMQIFCRSHPNNVSVAATIKWFKKKEESIDSIDDGNVCAGVMFSLADADQRREISELVGLLKGGTACCRECNASVSGEAAFCYNCGAKIPRKRAFLKKMLNTLLAGPDDPEYS
jgi:hypothetical protein